MRHVCLARLRGLFQEWFEFRVQYNSFAESASGPAGPFTAEGCCDTQAKPRSHDTARIAWAKLLARVGEEFPLECPNCGGDIQT